LAFCLGIAPIAKPGAIPGQTTADHDVADVVALQVADTDAPVVRAIAVEFAPQGAALNQLEHGLGGRGTPRFVTLRRSQTIEADRHAPDLDGVAVPNVRDLGDDHPGGTIGGRRGPGEHQDKDEQAQEAAVHDLLTTNAPGGSKSVLYRNDCMAIVPLPLSPGAEARALLHHLLEHGDIVGRDTAGRTIIQLALDDWTLEKLLVFDAEAAELEDADAEPEPDDEEDGPPVLLGLARPKVVGCRWPLSLAWGPGRLRHGT
jgi:hypothetical protein